jgi:hypothetical protein
MKKIILIALVLMGCGPYKPTYIKEKFYSSQFSRPMPFGICYYKDSQGYSWEDSCNKYQIGDVSPLNGK